ncbi:MAG: glycosyltransferase [bacterium]|nr:glycosyltransferase [bacterium]
MLLFAQRHLQNAAAIHCTSEREQSEVSRRRIGPPTFIVPNPIELEEFQSLPERGHLRQALGIPRNAAVILFLSRLHRKKGLDLSLRAFAKLCRGRGTEQIRFIIAGPAEQGYDNCVRQLVRGLGIGPFVHMIGMVRGQVRLQAFADSDIFILNSFQDNFGNSVAEAMACGLPVVISEKVDIAEIVRRNSCGIVVRQDVDDIFQALQCLILSRHLRREMRQRAKQTAMSEFSSVVVASKMARAYQAILAGSVTQTML